MLFIREQEDRVKEFLDMEKIPFTEHDSVFEEAVKEELFHYINGYKEAYPGRLEGYDAPDDLIKAKAKEIVEEGDWTEFNEFISEYAIVIIEKAEEIKEYQPEFADFKKLEVEVV